jgi:hypothetical protein
VLDFSSSSPRAIAAPRLRQARARRSLFVVVESKIMPTVSARGDAHADRCRRHPRRRRGADDGSRSTSRGPRAEHYDHADRRKRRDAPYERRRARHATTWPPCAPLPRSAQARSDRATIPRLRPQRVAQARPPRRRARGGQRDSSSCARYWRVVNLGERDRDALADRARSDGVEPLRQDAACGSRIDPRPRGKSMNGDMVGREFALREHGAHPARPWRPGKN